MRPTEGRLGEATVYSLNPGRRPLLRPPNDVRRRPLRLPAKRRASALARTGSLPAGKFWPRGRRHPQEKDAISGIYQPCNPAVAGRAGTRPGNFERREQGVFRRNGSGSGKEHAAAARRRIPAPSGCIGPDFAPIAVATRGAFGGLRPAQFRSWAQRDISVKTVASPYS